MLWRCGNPGQTFICIFACFTLDKYLHICLFMITNISVFAACDKYVYTIHIWFIFDEEVILSPTPVYYLPDPYFLEGGYVIQRERYEMIITWWNDILISNIHNHHHDRHHSRIADRALSRWGGGQEGWSDSNCRRDAAGCTRDGDDYDEGAGDDDDVDGGDDDCLFMKIYICSLITMDRLQLAAGCTSLN